MVTELTLEKKMAVSSSYATGKNEKICLSSLRDSNRTKLMFNFFN